MVFWSFLLNFFAVPDDDDDDVCNQYNPYCVEYAVKNIIWILLLIYLNVRYQYTRYWMFMFSIKRILCHATRSEWNTLKMINTIIITLLLLTVLSIVNPNDLYYDISYTWCISWVTSHIKAYAVWRLFCVHCRTITNVLIRAFTDCSNVNIWGRLVLINWYIYIIR